MALPGWVKEVKVTIQRKKEMKGFKFPKNPKVTRALKDD